VVVALVDPQLMRFSILDDDIRYDPAVDALAIGAERLRHARFVAVGRRSAGGSAGAGAGG